MSRTVGLALVALFAVATTSADAGGWGPPWRTSGYGYSVTYYYPVAVAVVPYYCAPAPVYVRPVPIYGNGYAQPQPAPPSGTGEPPLLKKPMAPPDVIESKSFSPGGTRGVKVGFWNITGRDVKLTINGKTHVLPRDRSLTLNVGREFSWQVDGQPTQEERLAEEKASHEIVLR